MLHFIIPTVWGQLNELVLFVIIYEILNLNGINENMLICLILMSKRKTIVVRTFIYSHLLLMVANVWYWFTFCLNTLNRRLNDYLSGWIQFHGSERIIFSFYHIDYYSKVKGKNIAFIVWSFEILDEMWYCDTVWWAIFPVLLYVPRQIMWCIFMSFPENNWNKNFTYE